MFTLMFNFYLLIPSWMARCQCIKEAGYKVLIISKDAISTAMVLPKLIICATRRDSLTRHGSASSLANDPVLNSMSQSSTSSAVIPTSNECGGA